MLTLGSAHARRVLQLVQRVLIIFMPQKYQPDYVYLRHVRSHRCHIFTAIQIACLAALWAIKSIKSISIIFPLMVRACAPTHRDVIIA